MSNNLISINEFNEASVASSKEHRLAKVIFRKSRDGSGIKSHNSQCASVMMISDAEIVGRISEFKSVVRKAIEGTQDEIIRASYLEGKKSIAESEISIDAVIAYLKAESTGNGRMSKESIKAWFDEKLSTELFAALMIKLGVSEIDKLTDKDTAKITGVISIYCEGFQGLAGGATMYSESKATQLIKAIDLADLSDDSLGVKFRTRLEEMIKKANMSMDELAL